MRIKILFFLLFALVVVFPYHDQFCFASDAKLTLNSADGSTSFQVRDSGNEVVGRIDSDGHMLVYGSATVNSGFIVQSGNTGLGTSNPLAKVHVFAPAGTSTPQVLLVSTGSTNLLEVNGSSIVVAVDIFKNATSTPYTFPDYVFEPNYKILTFLELKNFLKKNKHLPKIPSKEQVKKHGIALFEQSRYLLEKIEELYLYILQLDEIDKKLEFELSQIEYKIQKKPQNRNLERRH